MHKTDARSAALSSPSAALTRYKAKVCEHSPQWKFVYRWLRKRLCQRKAVSLNCCVSERAGRLSAVAEASSVAVRGKQTDNGTDNLKKTINMGKVSGKISHLSA
ncbi:hypothetical protein FHX51_000035 [Aeriscardovia aeriphila]|uniref:Uncharacterized protein n=1 Tax=Aeriscardovia aeriphila TaxID=218139 RepID=A0A261F7Q9_9BIFI|nr:hypothetical protein [Aeriscardovia aeriphila]OZG55124.1 hypothetical protein AEAE_1246 [Aeriscardovia aeriphila]